MDHRSRRRSRSLTFIVSFTELLNVSYAFLLIIKINMAFCFCFVESVFRKVIIWFWLRIFLTMLISEGAGEVAYGVLSHTHGHRFEPRIDISLGQPAFHPGSITWHLTRLGVWKHWLSAGHLSSLYLPQTHSIRHNGFEFRSNAGRIPQTWVICAQTLYPFWALFLFHPFWS